MNSVLLHNISSEGTKNFVAVWYTKEISELEDISLFFMYLMFHF